MTRVIIVFLIGVGCLVPSGCLKGMHGLTHPHSEVTAPTFCLYKVWKDGWEDEHSIDPIHYHDVRIINN